MNSLSREVTVFVIFELYQLRFMCQNRSLYIILKSGTLTLVNNTILQELTGGNKVILNGLKGLH